MLSVRLKRTERKANMIEERKYTISELSAVLGTNGKDNIEGKLQRYNIEYTVTGRSKDIVFDITAVNDKLKVFCILDIGFPAQTDINKLANFLYYFLNVEDFIILPDEAKALFMADNGRTLSRQTIANYIKRLITANLMYRSDKIIYYFIYKQKRTPTDKETYNKAWREYYADKVKGAEPSEAMLNLLINYGGYAKKYVVPEQNALELDRINYLNDLVLERIEQLYGKE